jgi:ABC-type spermidine/putrescine transport system permease subunit II
MSPYRLVVTTVPFFIMIAALGECVHNMFYDGISADYVVIDIYETAHEDIPRMVAMLATVMTVLGVVFTVLVTLLLVGRIIIIRRRHNRLMGK